MANELDLSAFAQQLSQQTQDVSADFAKSLSPESAVAGPGGRSDVSLAAAQQLGNFSSNPLAAFAQGRRIKDAEGFAALEAATAQRKAEVENAVKVQQATKVKLENNREVNSLGVGQAIATAKLGNPDQANAMLTQIVRNNIPEGVPVPAIQAFNPDTLTVSYTQSDGTQVTESISDLFENVGLDMTIALSSSQQATLEGQNAVQQRIAQIGAAQEAVTSGAIDPSQQAFATAGGRVDLAGTTGELAPTKKRIEERETLQKTDVQLKLLSDELLALPETAFGAGGLISSGVINITNTLKGVASVIPGIGDTVTSIIDNIPKGGTASEQEIASRNSAASALGFIVAAAMGQSGRAASDKDIKLANTIAGNPKSFFASKAKIKEAVGLLERLIATTGVTIGADLVVPAIPGGSLKFDNQGNPL